VWWLAEHRERGLTIALRLITDLGSPVGATVLAVAVCAGVAWTIRSFLPLLLGAIGPGGLGVVVTVIKAGVGRPRPAVPVAAVHAHGFSFPSGHAAGTAVVALTSAWMLTHWVVSRWSAQVTVWTTALLFIGTVGFSRVYLGVHYPSDVLGGWLLGATCAAAVGVAGSWWDYARRTRIQATAVPAENQGPAGESDERTT
jgi:membrane-associated phospholipid phosphatase